MFVAYYSNIIFGIFLCAVKFYNAVRYFVAENRKANTFHGVFALRKTV